MVRQLWPVKFGLVVDRGCVCWSGLGCPVTGSSHPMWRTCGGFASDKPAVANAQSEGNTHDPANLHQHQKPDIIPTSSISSSVFFLNSNGRRITFTEIQ